MFIPVTDLVIVMQINYYYYYYLIVSASQTVRTSINLDDVITETALLGILNDIYG